MIAVFITLSVLACLDGAFSGFRSSLGRSALVDHTADDRRGLRAGAVLVGLLLLPATVIAAIDLATGGDAAAYQRAGTAFLLVIGPYALLVVLALAGYRALHWRLRYLASALILGPFTLLRPCVVIIAAIVGASRGGDPVVGVSGGLACAAVLAVEPLLDRRWARDRAGG